VAQFKVLSRNLPGLTEENCENLSQDNRSPGRYLNSRSPEYVRGVLTTRPQTSFASNYDYFSSHRRFREIFTDWPVNLLSGCTLRSLVILIRTTREGFGRKLWRRHCSGRIKEDYIIWKDSSEANIRTCYWLWVYLHSINPKQVSTFGYRTSQRVTYSYISLLVQINLA
jgi:hypothetical protein